MHEDLRRRALESKKTLSRKARSKQPSLHSSAANSRSNSKVASRAGSRAGSDDEDDAFSDDTAWSANSIDGVPEIGEEETPVNWIDELSARIARILDRKRSSIHGREEDLAVYCHILRHQFAKSIISSQLSPLLSAFLKTVKAETSERETVLALQAISLSAITDPTEDTGSTFELCMDPLKTTISSVESTVIKAQAINSLSTVTFFGSSIDETEEIMEFLLEIVESDGATVSALDSPEVVIAALESWGFLATQMDDMEDSTHTAMEALVDQLESGDARVQIASGEDIALLYEKSYTERESDDEASDDTDSLEPDAPDPGMVKRYEPYDRKDQLLHSFTSLAKISAKSISKKDRKSLRTNFADIAKSVENPTLGPRYSSAIDKETDRHYGSRMMVQVGNGNGMRIDKWWKLHRLKGLKRVLQGGFLEHYQKNEVILETLPVLTVARARNGKD